MSMSTHVEGFINSNNKTYIEYKKIFEQCQKAKVSLPTEVEKYFEDCYRPEDKLRIELKIKEWSDDCGSSGYELLVKDIPEGVEKIRFFNNW